MGKVPPGQRQLCPEASARADPRGLLPTEAASPPTARGARGWMDLYVTPPPAHPSPLQLSPTVPRGHHTRAPLGKGAQGEQGQTPPLNPLSRTAVGTGVGFRVRQTYIQTPSPRAAKQSSREHLAQHLHPQRLTQRRFWKQYPTPSLCSWFCLQPTESDPLLCNCPESPRPPGHKRSHPFGLLGHKSTTWQGPFPAGKSFPVSTQAPVSCPPPPAGASASQAGVGGGVCAANPAPPSAGGHLPPPAERARRPGLSLLSRPHDYSWLRCPDALRSIAPKHVGDKQSVSRFLFCMLGKEKSAATFYTVTTTHQRRDILGPRTSKDITSEQTESLWA